jgi:hypothetical protein
VRFTAAAKQLAVAPFLHRKRRLTSRTNGLHRPSLAALRLIIFIILYKFQAREISLLPFIDKRQEMKISH